MAIIYLFRHGQTYNNRRKIFTGWHDSKLTPTGISQTKKVANKLAKVNFALAYQSPLKRSHTTLKIVLKHHPECHKIITDQRIIERRYGTLETLYHSTVIKQFGLSQFKLWHRDFDIRPPGGESFADVEERVKSFLSDLKHKYTNQSINIAISAHGNSIRLMRYLLEHASKKQASSWIIRYQKVYKYFL